ncbi:MAG: tyrosine-type recombinase/integrase [Ewingella americana]|jgi:integrase|uniref:phage integrase n=1 Tax=Ewingella americana TaxID=41202 RepID=UPI0024304589|nr:tyrosine-type recombinase/integrase [Ewingella americana]MCI1680025.1 tyrosine-type recombinase/integrase [Ewingella americana]MCI1855020.1 tyrosine-type recombinase/integrase [Ewingella americana]MCI1863497.1 tyrosine-type recombinase/integrase [Ewingella americana]MCI2143367.1 tyrosine-type recombinase/integrase [Ewingella americana]MCI2164524.1 tyrosine-type recombinase/integrase [Ewingella americana]
MTVKKLPTGEWQTDFYAAGRHGKRIRKTFATKGEATAFENFTIKEAEEKPWKGEKVDNRKLSTLVELWHDLHGQSLTASKSRLGKLNIIVRGLRDPVASRITTKDWAHYRDQRLKGEIDNGYHTDPEQWKVKPVTVNREHHYLYAMFNELKRLGEWTGPNPLDGIRAFKEEDREMSWLTKNQINSLLKACKVYGKEHVTRIVKICLATGARWTEANNLTRSQLSPQKLTFYKTKGKKNRTVPIPKWLYSELKPLSGQFSKPCYQEFKKVVALTDIELSEGQMTHVLRHTFGAHFMMNGGNILVLQKVLGHANIRETMRYAHFAPDHLEQAVLLSPLSDINDFN